MTKILSFTPSDKLQKALKTTQSEIVRFSEVIARMSDDEYDWLHRWALISTVGASTRIENAILTDAEIEWVDTTLFTKGHETAFEVKKAAILEKLSKDRERSVEEVVGCRELMSVVYLQANELYPLSETTIRGLHQTLLRFYPDGDHYAGRYKTSSNQVVSLNHETKEKRVVLNPAPPGPQTEAAIRSLVDWYNPAIKNHPWPLLVATEFVFRFLAIHPFQDGNGRLGRALFLMAMMQAGESELQKIIGLISIDRQIERHRPLYYSVLQQTSGGEYRSDPADYNFEPLAWFFLKMLDHSLADITILRKRYEALSRLSESAELVLACFRLAPEKRLRPADIIAETGLVRRTVQNSLTTLLKEGFVQRLGAGAGTRYQLIF
jgi:Fic family protein